ncbi:hypothetical protein BJL90_18690 [Clostridium formicaceticum]|uniref:HTH merR-type domain-containing protein n=1 Tax=Clostridium formicaceticum TaxID=1497 RepID=A0ABN4TE89_9CLOT|nr:hypothetical protein BJL90_18690 [Clostridium formicaceticum]
MGLSLDTIRLMLNKYDNTQVIRKYLDMFYNQKLKEYNELKYQLNLIDTAINQLKNGNFCMDHNIVVKTLLERQVAHYTEKIPFGICYVMRSSRNVLNLKIHHIIW